MKNIIKIFIVLLSLPLILGACAKNLGNNQYVDSSTVGIVYEGTIISSRPVTIKPDDKEDPKLGALAGGVGGGVAGSTIGQGKGSTLAAVGGAVAGAVLGDMIEESLNSQQGYEYIVRLNEESLSESVKEKNENIRLNDPSIGNKLKSTTKIGLKSKTISVIQTDMQPFAAGQKVYVIYNDDRPRITPIF